MDYFVSEDAINDYKELILQGEHKSEKDICKDINKMVMRGTLVDKQNAIKVIEFRNYLIVLNGRVIEYIYEQKIRI